jgi:hypothetical protein
MMDGIKRVNGGANTAHSSAVDHRRIQKSSTLNRKFVKKPVARPRISAAAGAASKSLRQHGQQRSMEMIQKRNSVKLQPSQQGARQQSAKVAVQQQQSAAKQQAQQGQQRQAAQQQQRVAAARQQVSAAKAQQGQRQAQQQRVAASRKQIIAEKKEADVLERNKTAQAARARIAARKAAAQPEHLSAQELKDRAIQQALRKVDRIEEKKDLGVQFTNEGQQKAHFWQKKSFAITACMAIVSLALLGYLVALNMPDISVRVAAMQTGIEKIYPSYVPSNYRLDGLVKEDAGRVTMNFKNDDGKKFILMEEKSSWDSAAVLSNYVKKNWGNNYSIAKGQGLTIYISGSNAAWVNGGVFYVITNEDGALSATDLHDIAVSL